MMCLGDSCGNVVQTSKTDKIFRIGLLPGLSLVFNNLDEIRKVEEDNIVVCLIH